MYQKLKLFLIFSLLNSCFAFAQVSSSLNNPYSSYGFGELRPMSSLRNSGMAGTGLAFSDKEYINFINPALLSRTRTIVHSVVAGETVVSIAKTYSVTEDEIRTLNKLSGEVTEGMQLKIPVRKYTKFEAAARGGLRNVSQAQGDYSENYLNYQHFVLLFPLGQKISTSLGITPYSTTNSGTFYEYTIPGDTTVAKVSNKKTGGLNQIFIGAGYDVSKNISVGLQGGFIFGNIKSESFNQLRSQNTAEYGDKFGTYSQVSYKAFSFKPSVFYTTALKSPGDSSLFLNLTSAFTFTSDANSSQSLSFQNRNRYDEVISDSTIQTADTEFNFPQEVSFGVALNKVNRWTIGADFIYGNWSQLNSGSTDFEYTNSYKISLGAESKFTRRGRILTPKSPAFRAGLSYAQLPYLLNGEQVKDYAFSIGTSLPVGRLNPADKNQPLTKISLALTAGLQGDENLGPGQEFYLNFNAGILINDKWFTRKRIQ